MKRAVVTIGILLTFLFGVAQEPQQNLIESMIEFLAENSDEELDIEELTEIWEFYLENPMNINTATSDDLHQLRILNELQVQNLLVYKEQNGSLYSIYELQAVDGFDRELIERLQPFIVFQESEKKELKKQRVKRELIVRGTRTAERARGFLDKDAYEGSPEKYYLRYKQSGEQFKFGFTAEKDAGEAFLRGSNSAGFDYNSGFANYQSKNKKYGLFLGDYLVKAGQGLVICQGFASGKSSEVNKTYNSNTGISSYSSADENRFFRGAAAEWNMKHARLTAFQSYKRIDGNTEIQSGETVITSLQTSGLHATPSEIEDENAIRETVSGLTFSFQKNNFSVGMATTYTRFDKKLVPDDKLSNQFLFSGDKIGNIGIDYKWSIKKLFLFGELAGSSTGGFATINGALIKPSDQLELSVLYRNLSKKYNTLYGQAVSESSRVNDEQGLYVGAKVWPVAKITLSAYYDLYSFRWIKSQTASPSKGNELFFQLDYNATKNIKAYLRYFSEEKETGSAGGTLKFNTNQQIQRIRLNFDFQINDQIVLKSRAEVSSFNHEKTENGLLLLQDIKYMALKIPLTLQLRLAWFDTDSYNCRLYAYENDLLHNFSVPALSGKGIRMYINGKYQLSKKLDIWFKIARTQYYGQTSISSGLAEIEGDRKTELKLQLRYRF